MLAKKIRAFLRNKNRAYLRRILKEPAFALAVCTAVIGIGIVQASHEPAVPNVLDGSAVITINGAAANDLSGYSVSGGGDVNGDGIDDIVIGAFKAYGQAGKTYVIFGTTTPTAINLSAIAGGTGGFVITGADFVDHSGFSVSIGGNIDNDDNGFDDNGYDDIIIGAPQADGAGGAEGKTYVVFGKNNGTAVSLNDIETDTGGHGFVINGVATGNNSGFSVSGAGNVNNDSFDDIIIGANRADAGANFLNGRSYVVFGKSTTTAVDLADLQSATPTGGFVINGIATTTYSGYSVSGAGNVNGDSFDDIIVGAPGTNYSNGEAYVVFGKSSTDAVELSSIVSGTGGFAMNRDTDSDDKLGWSVSGAGDVNGDGMDDIIVGSPGSVGYNGDNVGDSFVVFGRVSTSIIDLDDLETNRAVSQSKGSVLAITQDQASRVQET